MNDGYIMASEIGEYVFCKRAWWLRRKGFLKTTAEMVKGNQKHDTLFAKILSLQRKQIIALAALLIGTLLIMVFFLIKLWT